MKLKRILPLFLALVMVLSCVVVVPFTASAEEQAPTGADEATAGYKEIVPGSSVKVPPGTTTISASTLVPGTALAEVAYVTISSPADLIAYCKFIRGTAGANALKSGSVVYLTADIDMAGQTMSPIGGLGTKDHSNGATTNTGLSAGTTFDGNGYKIKNLDLTRDKTYAGNQVGLFGIAWGTVKNVYLDEGCVFTQDVNAATGSVIADMRGGSKIENCYSSATVSNTDAGHAAGLGGLVGVVFDVSTTIDNCTFAGKVSESGTCVGGIVGEVNYNKKAITVTVSDCVNEGTVLQHTYTNAGNMSAGGIVGVFTAAASSQLTITNCINKSSDIGVTGGDGHTAGILGFYRTYSITNTNAKGLVIKDCTNSGNVYTHTLNNKVRLLRTAQIYNVPAQIAGGYAIPNPTTCPTTVTNCKTVSAADIKAVFATSAFKDYLEPGNGYSADRIVKVDTTDLPEITKTTTAADITAAAYVIKDADGLLKFNEIALTAYPATKDVAAYDPFKEKTIYLGDNIDLKGAAWAPIDAFTGTFDGQGYRIKNLVCDNPSNTSYVGFLANTYGATIKNLIMDASCVFRTTSGGKVIGVFMGHSGSMNNVITNCMNEATVLSGATAAGIANGERGTITYCTNKGTVISHGNGNAGGIHGGSSAAGHIIAYNVNYGTVICQNVSSSTTSSNDAAGIVGRLGRASYVIGNTNYGTILAGTGDMAGIANVDQSDGAQTHHIYNNTNYGTVGDADADSVNPAVAVRFVFAKAEATTHLYNNVMSESYIGYNADMISKISDYTSIPDITEVFTLTGAVDPKATASNVTVTTAPTKTETVITRTGAVGTNTYTTTLKVEKKTSGNTTVPTTTTVGTIGTPKKIPPMVKITNKEGVRMLSAVAYYSPMALATTSVVLADNVNMTGMTDDPTNKFAEENDFLPIGWNASIGVTENIADRKQVYSCYIGMFDGQGYTIDNMQLTGSTNQTNNVVGLFNCVNHGTIQNLVFGENNKITGHAVSNYGLVIDVFSSNLNNIHNKMSSGIENGIRKAGGIVNFLNYSTVTNCTNDGNISGYTGAGGIAGIAQASTISNCRNNGTISVSYDAGATFANRNETANIAGGILAVSQGFELNVFNNVNNGKVFGYKDMVANNLKAGDYKSWVGTENEANIPADGTVFKSPVGAIIGRINPAVTNKATNVANNYDYAGVYKSDALNTDLKLLVGGDTASLKTVDVGTNTDRAFLEDMLATKYQAKEPVGGTQDIRLLSTIDGRYDNYTEVGFIIEAGDRTAVVDMTAIYTSVIAMKDGEANICDPEKYGASVSEYFFAFKLNEAPEGFIARAYVKTQNGTMLKGTVLTVPTPTAPVN